MEAVARLGCLNCGAPASEARQISQCLTMLRDNPLDLSGAGKAATRTRRHEPVSPEHSEPSQTCTLATDDSGVGHCDFFWLRRRLGLFRACRENIGRRRRGWRDGVGSGRARVGSLSASGSDCWTLPAGSRRGREREAVNRGLSNPFRWVTQLLRHQMFARGWHTSTDELRKIRR